MTLTEYLPVPYLNYLDHQEDVEFALIEMLASIAEVDVTRFILAFINPDFLVVTNYSSSPGPVRRLLSTTPTVTIELNPGKIIAHLGIYGCGEGPESAQESSGVCTDAPAVLAAIVDCLQGVFFLLSPGCNQAVNSTYTAFHDEGVLPPGVTFDAFSTGFSISGATTSPNLLVSGTPTTTPAPTTTTTTTVVNTTTAQPTNATFIYLPSGGSSGFTTAAIIGTAVGGFVVALILILILIVWSRRSSAQYSIITTPLNV